ncbi:hypothetical protein [Mycobacterium sp. DBP42]|uniref:hypothetical protein n=1 Tax=Mycobacterium sp. DBP42 TaxID=2545267 RepID=UPI00110CCAB5|nr:hypothetical protein [Mycobacterium sp. DBP42]TMS50966.1 hypothetical protein E0T84_21495 [Mycobacterium sp. DBP42]
MTDNILEPVDGTVYAYQVAPHECLAYVTIAGPDEDEPMIIGFDLADLNHLKAARKELRAGAKALKGRPTEPDPGAVLQILSAARSGHFVHDRVEYRYDTERGEWVAWGRTDVDNPEPPREFETDLTW